MPTEILACRWHANHRNFVAIRPINVIARGEMRVSMNDQFCAMLANDFLETTDTIEPLMSGSRTVDWRMVDHHNTEKTLRTSFVKQLCKTFGLRRAKIATGHKRCRGACR